MQLLHRRIRRTITLPAPSPGFLGPGHTAIEVLDPAALEASDPFVLLMDDRLDLGPVVRKIGGAHPHAGIETVTLFLEGNVADKDEGDTTPGDAQWMTAGRGVIHSENIRTAGRSRILQLWIRLPKADRSVPPRVQLIRKATLPIRREPGAEVRIYSGSSGGLASPTLNYAPVTIVDVHLQPGAVIEQELPTSYSGFAYVIEGDARVGADRAVVATGQVGWLDRPAGNGVSALRFEGGERGARVVLYAGQPQREPMIHHGPFVAGSEPELVRLFTEYRGGRFQRLSQLTSTVA